MELIGGGIFSSGLGWRNLPLTESVEEQRAGHSFDFLFLSVCWYDGFLIAVFAYVGRGE